MAVISSNAYLTMEQMTGNAQYILNYLMARGWTKEAVCAMLGNMQSESTINPGIWQGLDSSRVDLGYGLVQWTPSTKYTSWANGRGYAIGDIDGQLERIIYEKENSIQWQQVTTTMTFAQFSTSTASVETLAELFELNYEQHAGSAQPARKTQARYWYNNLSGSTDDGSAAVIEKVCSWEVAIANDNSHGYDQASREGPDYDCSSFQYHGWKQGGIDMISSRGYSGTTSTMLADFTANGFHDVIGSVDVSTGNGLKRGDVLLRSGYHTALYLGNAQIVHASINEHGDVVGGTTGDQTGTEICVRSYYNYNPSWNHVLRYKSGGSGGGGVSTDLYIVEFIPE